MRVREGTDVDTDGETGAVAANAQGPVLAIVDLFAERTAALAILVLVPALVPILSLTLRALEAVREVARGVTLAIVADRSARDLLRANGSRKNASHVNENSSNALTLRHAK